MTFEYTWPIRLQDVDRFEMLYYSRVFEALQRGVEALFEAGGRSYREVAETRYTFPIVATNAEYNRQVTWEETVTLEITPSIGETSFNFDGSGNVDGESAFDVERTQVVIDTETEEIAPVPPEIREPLEAVAE